MFSTAFKALSSNISANYTLAPHPSSQAGPWDVFDATRKSTGKPASVFVFDRKKLDPSRGSSGAAALGGRGGTASLKRANDEVLDRLKQEASSLARLRHPSILELAEPVEETRSGGLMFATEPVTASLGALLLDKDTQERGDGRKSRFVVEDESSKRRDWELDELEIQKGLLQLGKGLEFLHESAGLVHANLTPEAIMINAKGDWKISGLAFCGPHSASTAATSLIPINLHEALMSDPRLPRNVQMNLDYTSPDFVMDNSLTPAADLFSLGLLILALYNSPHVSPISVGGSQSSYKRIFSAASTIPTRQNNFLIPAGSKYPLPTTLANDLLPSLITRRAAQRLNATAFQQAPYFDNLLVSTLRFLDDLPAKSSIEKTQFLRGLPQIVPQFPSHVLERKLLPALLEEMKDRELLPLVLSCVFKVVEGVSSDEAAKSSFSTVVVPRLREIFLPPSGNASTTKAGATSDRDTSKDPALIILLAHTSLICSRCTGAVFSADILPIILLALESPTHAVIDAALRSLNPVLAVLDYSTMRNKLFPATAHVFAKTSSLSIKICALESLGTLCGGPPIGSKAIGRLEMDDDDDGDDGLTGLASPTQKSPTSSAILDKHTIQEKLVPLLKGIKTKEPAVMMAALRVFRQVGGIADAEFLATDVLPTLWSMALGPLLDLQQFQSFMQLIKRLGKKIEGEQIRKLKSLGSEAGASIGLRNKPTVGNAGSGSGLNAMVGGEEVDFASLVSGRKPGLPAEDLMNDWSSTPSTIAQKATSSAPSSQLAWQSQPTLRSSMSLSSASNTRTVTPDQSLSSFAAMTPQSQFSQPLQPSTRAASGGTIPTSYVNTRPGVDVHQPTSSLGLANGTSIDWSSAASKKSHYTTSSNQNQMSPATNGFGLPPPPMSPPALQSWSKPQTQIPKLSSNQGGSGLDKYESLI
ncbi:Hypothetical protein R9X50_00249800 [Acrodontium crateriforme]|uniref:Protein kinase domain-containing protein n=1 Tax=Acrodontium crateriforme TaxID=150365 RepID=A0AAQ3M1A0_9PEZI|nr:Hypothetical protein R9X50_00249800 [Acrodontium crateriforme]